MSKAFYAGIREIFGEEVQVIDRFHVVKYAVDALDEVIRSVQQQLDEDENKAFKKLRKRWLKSKDQLDVMSEDSHWSSGLSVTSGVADSPSCERC